MPKRIRISSWLRLKSSAGKRHLSKLHKKSGKRGYYKLPGIRKHFIHDRSLRLKAKTSAKERRNILARLRRMFMKKTGNGRRKTGVARKAMVQDLAKKLGAYVKKFGSPYYGIPAPSGKVPRRNHK